MSSADLFFFLNLELSLYVKGIVNGMNRHVLDKTFRTFGTVINLDVVPSKSCAFVEFATKEAWQRALTQKSIDISNLGSVTVEERKVKGKKHSEDLGTVIVEEAKEKEQKLGENLGTDMADEVNRELSLYVKGIVNGMNRHVLDKTFRTFGTVINLDVVPSKSCAFVEFATEEAYQKALTQKSIEIPNLGIVTVEQRKPKKPRTQNQRNRYKTSNSL